MPFKLNNLISEFLEYLKKQGRSELTVRNYRLYLGRFLEFSKNPLPNKIDKEMVDEYQEWLKNLNEKSRLIQIKKNLKKNTINYHLIALRCFLKYLSDEKINSLKPEKIELEKIPKRKIEFLNVGIIEKILEAPFKLDIEKTIQLRDKAILETFFATGIRVSELSKLKRSNINGDLISIKGKQGKIRQLKLTNQAKYYLKKYLDSRTDKLLALFIGHDRAARARKFKKLVPESNLSDRSIQRIVKKYAKIAGIDPPIGETGKRITPQTLRSLVGRRMLASGCNEREAQTMLGHESVTTTRRYKIFG